MAKTFDAAQIVARNIHDEVRKRALKAIGEHDAQLSKVFDAIAAGIRRDLRASGFSIAQVRDILQKHLAGTAEQRVAIIENAIRAAAYEGHALDKKTFDAVFGPDAATSAPPPFVPSSRPAPVRLLKRRRESGD